MAILGINGKPIVSEEFEYVIDEFGFKSKATPEDAYRKAHSDVQNALVAQGLPVSAAHPFALEPGAQAMFMGVSLELKRLRARLDKLEAEQEPEPEEKDCGSRNTN